MASAEGRPSRGALATIEHLLRGTDRVFFTLFEEAADNVAHAAQLLSDLLVGFPETQGLVSEITQCERLGDQLTHRLVTRLNEAFVTPIDREDILQLGSVLDDIVDFIEQIAGYLVLFRIEAPMVQAQDLAGLLRDSTQQIAQATRRVSSFKDVSSYTAEVHRLENEGDRIVREAIASLFVDRIDPLVVIRWKDIFERLEDAIDATERAANVLDGIVIKNG